MIPTTLIFHLIIYLFLIENIDPYALYGSQIDKSLTYHAESTGKHVYDYEHTLQEMYERVKVVAPDLTEEMFAAIHM